MSMVGQKRYKPLLSDSSFMTINFEDYKCEFCGKPSTNFVFAAFVCDDPECIEKARIARGGPGGHMKRRAEGLPIVPDELVEFTDDGGKQ